MHLTFTASIVPFDCKLPLERMQAQLQTLAHFATFAGGDLLEARPLLPHDFQREAVLKAGGLPLASFLPRAGLVQAQPSWKAIC